jgi:ribosomal protein L27
LKTTNHNTFIAKQRGVKKYIGLNVLNMADDTKMAAEILYEKYR